MKRSDLAQEIEIQFEAIQANVDQLASLQRDVAEARAEFAGGAARTVSPESLTPRRKGAKM
jgi:hypothetical protein